MAEVEQSASSSQKLPRYEEYLAQWPGPPSHQGRLYDDRYEGWIPVANHHCLNGYRAVTAMPAVYGQSNVWITNISTAYERPK